MLPLHQARRPPFRPGSSTVRHRGKCLRLTLLGLPVACMLYFCVKMASLAGPSSGSTELEELAPPARVAGVPPALQPSISRNKQHVVYKAAEDEEEDPFGLSEGGRGGGGGESEGEQGQRGDDDVVAAAAAAVAAAAAAAEPPPPPPPPPPPAHAAREAAAAAAAAAAVEEVPQQVQAEAPRTEDEQQAPPPPPPPPGPAAPYPQHEHAFRLDAFPQLKSAVQASGLAGSVQELHLPYPPSWALRPGSPAPPYRMEAPSLAHGPMAAHLAAVSADPVRQAAVRAAFKHAWEPYVAHAWGKDLLKPVSKSSDNGFLGMGISIVDALDTMLIMGLHDEYRMGRDWVVSSLKLAAQEDINLFETTIRVLGGLIAAYDLSGRNDTELLAVARASADALAFGFDSKTGIPYGTLGLASHRKYNPPWMQSSSTVSEVTSLQLEWEALSQVTGDPQYALLARRPMAVLQSVEPSDSLYPMFLNPDSGSWTSQSITFGARADSLYEYLLKQYLLLGGGRDTRLGAAGAGASRLRRRSDAAGLGNPALVGGDANAPGGSGGGAPVAQPVLASRYGPPSTCAAHLVWDWAGGYAVGVAHPDDSEDPYRCTEATTPWYGKSCSGSGEGSDEEGAASKRGGSHPHPLLYAAPESTAPSSPDTELAWAESLFGMYWRSMAGMEGQLLRRSTPGNFTYLAERLGGTFDDKMDHLVCFVPGMLALGATVAPTEALRSHHLALADEIMRTCVQMYEMTPIFIAPEITRFPGGGDPVVDQGAKHNLLRPETVESLFVLYRVTGNEKYREDGWRIFQAFEKWSKVPAGGYSTLHDVTVVPPAQSDVQESFFLAETLKYLYLLFSESELISLDSYVFNTEAHPLRVFPPVAHA